MSRDLPDSVIRQLLEALVSTERLTGNDHFDTRVLPEEDEEGNEIFYHGSGDGLRNGKLEEYLYVAPHPMFATGYSDQAHKDEIPAYKDDPRLYNKDTAHKVFKIKVPKGRAIHVNTYTDPFYVNDPYRDPEPEDEYEQVLMRSENPFNYVIDDTNDLELEDYEITPELIDLMKEYWEPKELFEKLKSSRNIIDGITRKY